MGGGDLNAKKAWHPNTLKNQERVWKAEQAAAEEKKRIAELERERHLERERAELNKLAKSNLAHSKLTGDDRLHWMYEKPDKKVQQEEYLLGKTIDKNHEQAGKYEADEIPAVSRRVVGSSMLTVSGDSQVDLARKLREDPLLLVKERERAARAALLNNPVQRARLAELLRKEQKTKKESKSKKKKKRSEDLDNILAEKLQALNSKKSIDLALLLASDDSSSESSDEKSRKKKKKNKKKSKSKNVTLDDSDLTDNKEQRHKIKKNNKQNRDNIVSDSVITKRKKRHHSIENESTHSNINRRCKVSNEDHQSSDNNDLGELKHKSKYGSKNEPKKYISDKPKKEATTESDNLDIKRKKRLHSIEKETTKSHIKKHHSSSEDDESSDDEHSRDDRLTKVTRNYETQGRYWNHKQYSSDYQKLKSNQYSKNESQQKYDKYVRGEEELKKERYSADNRYKHERGRRQRDTSTYQSSMKLRNDCKNEKNKVRIESDASTSDKGWRSNKRSALSEEEKATKLAEMVAAGAEREKQRERRVADQLATKETDDRPNTNSRSRNVIRQLPDSLESRIHSNRHYIQRDQRHMNENFARR